VLIALRVTPRVRYGLQLLAQRERCSMSEFVLRTIEAKFNESVTGLHLVAQGERKPTNVLDRVFSPRDDWERVVRVAILFPSLLNDWESYVWRLIQEAPQFWKRNLMPERPNPDDVQWEVLAKAWPSLKRRAGMP
jgi:hypothetical protein